MYEANSSAMSSVTVISGVNSSALMSARRMRRFYLHPHHHVRQACSGTACHKMEVGRLHGLAAVSGRHGKGAMLASWPICSTPQPQLSLDVASRFSATCTHSNGHQVTLTIRNNGIAECSVRFGPRDNDGALRVSFKSCEVLARGRLYEYERSRESSVGIATGYGPDDRGVGV
jgi:hypothetical protein